MYRGQWRDAVAGPQALLTRGVPPSAPEVPFIADGTSTVTSQMDVITNQKGTLSNQNCTIVSQMGAALSLKWHHKAEARHPEAKHRKGGLIAWMP